MARAARCASATRSLFTPGKREQLAQYLGMPLGRLRTFSGSAASQRETCPKCLDVKAQSRPASHVQAISAGHSLSEASGGAATVSRAVRKALRQHAEPAKHPATTPAKKK